MAINMVGRCYDLGWGTPVMKDRAAACFRIAAEMGLDWGMYNYATLLALGEGVDEDKAAAFGWLEKARSEEHTSELQSLMRISYAVFCLKKTNQAAATRSTRVSYRSYVYCV